MPYNLIVNTEKQYIHLTYSGSVSFEERKQAKDEVISGCFEHGYYRALVDLRDSNIKMSRADVVKFAALFKHTKLPDNYRLACIIDSDNQSEELIEIIISQDGINIKYFLDFNEAENWLKAI